MIEERKLLLFLINLLCFFVNITGDSLETDREALLRLKFYLESKNPVNRRNYDRWSETDLSPCNWPGITCTAERVTGINLSDSNILGEIFSNFSALTELSHLDLSRNTLCNQIPADLNRCGSLRYLNLSYNALEGELNLTGLTKLENLDLTNNRLNGTIKTSFPAICDSLITLNLSSNHFSGNILGCFDDCLKIQYLDISSNDLIGPLWLGFARLLEFSVSENNLTGEVSPAIFNGNCSLQVLDLSGNLLSDTFPPEISKCGDLITLNLWGNLFSGNIPTEFGLLSKLEDLFLGNNSFNKEIPGSLVNCTSLAFLDLSKNSFGGEIQPILGTFKQLKFLVLHGNNYTGGIENSGILQLPNVVRLDLSYNNFSGGLPVQIAEMPNLTFLILAYNNFSGEILPDYGNLNGLQALDLSFNSLTGPIPAEIGKLQSLLWLMLADNYLTGPIPPEIGNCSSLLWLNLANNRLSGKIPREISRIGQNPYPTFEMNKKNEQVLAASGECLIMKRWIPATYPPFSFVYMVLTRKNCRGIWDRLLKGYGIFPLCLNKTGNPANRTLVISGYLQLTGNQLSGEVPPEIGKMKDLSLIHLSINNLSGPLPPEIGHIPLAVLNVSFNKFSGNIPSALGDITCLQSLDLANNNFSGEFPSSLSELTDLNKFNVSYNPLLSGVVPVTGQLGTFEKDSFLGVPLLKVEALRNNSNDNGNGNGNGNKTSPGNSKSGGSRKKNKAAGMALFLVFLVLTMAFMVLGLVSFIFCLVVRSPVTETAGFLLVESKRRHDQGQSSSEISLADCIEIFRLDKTVAFTYADILTATENFSEKRIVGKGGYGTVFRGVLYDGREVAVKKLQREGEEGEREFRAEMEVLSGGGMGWRHPNLVALYGWCLFGSEKLLVYEYLPGGSLEDWVSGFRKSGWTERLNVVVGVAKALVFLHHECFPAVVHRDVKASNVLLDSEGRAKVTDFGLARVVEPGDSHVSTVVAGTVGYVAPEYGQTWRATTRGDVYSFGVLVMEVATGRRAVGEEKGEGECLVDWVRRIAGEGRKALGAAVDLDVVAEGAEGVDGMVGCLEVALRCTEEKPQLRPDMRQVLAALLRIGGGGGGSVLTSYCC